MIGHCCAIQIPKGKLERLLANERGPIYKSLADLRIATDELSQEESAYGVAESARVFFCSAPAPLTHRASRSRSTGPQEPDHRRSAAG
jgi:hypothetical protein